MNQSQLVIDNQLSVQWAFLLQCCKVSILYNWQKKIVTDTFFDLNRRVYLTLLKENNKNVVKKFVDSEFVKTCHE